MKAKARFVGAATGLTGGVLAALLGSTLTAAGWFAANEAVRRWLSTAGTILLFLTIPLIILGGYCMDWMEKYEMVRDQESGRTSGRTGRR